MRYILILLALSALAVSGAEGEASSIKREASQKNRLKATHRVWGFTVADYSHDWVFHAYAEMSLSQIQKVFKDHLRQFPKRYARKLAIHLRGVCEKYSFDPAFILAIIHAESAFRSKVISFKGATGLMQILPSTGRWIARKKRIRYRGARDLSNPFVNISIGVAYLAILRDKYNGSLSHFLSAYNAGPGRVDKFVSRNIFYRLKTRNYVEKIRRKTPTIRIYGKTVRMVRSG